MKSERKMLWATLWATIIAALINNNVSLLVNPNVSMKNEKKLKIEEASLVPMFQDSFEEISTPTVIQMEGSVPNYVKGILLRNGPSIYGPKPRSEKRILDFLRGPQRRYSHVFDGLARLTKFEFKSNNQVYLSSKLLRSDWYKKIVEKGFLPASVTAGEVQPSFNIFQRIKALFTGTSFDNTPVNIHQVGDDSGPWVATTDAPVLLEFDLETLDTIQRLHLKEAGEFKDIFSTAHPHHLKSFTYNYVLSGNLSPLNQGPKFQIRIVRTDSQLKQEVVGAVDVSTSTIPYIHDFSITDKYVILFVWPMGFDLADFIQGKGFMSQMRWTGASDDPDLKYTKIYVFDIENTTSLEPCRVFTAPPLFAYHHINAYEREDGIVVDICTYDSPRIANGEFGYAYLANVKDPERRKRQEREGQVYRFHLPILPADSSEGSSHVLPQILPARDAQGIVYTSEFPRINPRYKMKPYRFAYSVTGFAGMNRKLSAQ